VTVTCRGGLDGTISSTPTDGETAPLNLKLAVPKALGGNGDSGHNPDQFLAAGYSGRISESNITFLMTWLMKKKKSVLAGRDPSRFRERRQERSRRARCGACECHPRRAHGSSRVWSQSGIACRRSRGSGDPGCRTRGSS